MKLSETKLSKMFEYGIPERMHGGIIRYYEHGTPPGDFLTAVINNDLKEAVSRADSENSNCLKAYVLWFYNQAPMGSWGHDGACDNWVKEFRHEV